MFESLRKRNPNKPQIHKCFSGSKYVCYVLGSTATGFGSTMRAAYNDWLLVGGHAQ